MTNQTFTNKVALVVETEKNCNNFLYIPIYFVRAMMQILFKFSIFKTNCNKVHTLRKSATFT